MNWFREKKYTYSGPGYGLPRLLSLIYLSLSRGLLNKLLYGENPPRGPTPYHFVYPILDWKGTPFVYTLHWQMVLLWIPFNCCKCTVFHKILLLALSGYFTDRNDRFSFPFIYFSKWNSYPLRCPRPPPESLLTPPGDTGEATDEYRDRRNETHLSDSVKIEIRKRIFLLYITVGYLTHCPSTKEYLKVFFKIDILTTGTPYPVILLRQTMLSTSRSLCTYKHLSDRSHNALTLYISYLNFISSYISYLTLCI